MPKRYSIWGREQFHFDQKDHELAQCDSNPQALKRAFEAKTVMINHGLGANTKRPRTKCKQYIFIRIIDNVDNSEVK